MKYEVHFRRSFSSRKDYTKIGEAMTLDEAADLRAVSGDLVVDGETYMVVNDPSWLWEWEKQDKDSYACRAMRYDNPKKDEAVDE